MASYDGDIQLTVNLTPGDVVSAAQKISNQVNQVWAKSNGKMSLKTKSVLVNIDQMNTKLTETIGRMRALENIKIPTKEFEDLQQKMEAVSDAMDVSYETIGQYKEELQNLESSMKLPTSAYTAAKKEVNELSHKLSVLVFQREKFIEGGGDTKSEVFTNLQTEIDNVTASLKQATANVQELEATGKAFTLDKYLAGQHARISDALQEEEANAQQLLGTYRDLVNQELDLEESGRAYTLGSETEEYYHLAASAGEYENKLTLLLGKLMAIGEIDIRKLPEKALNALASAAKKAAIAIKDAAVNLAKMASTGIKNKIKELAKSMLGLNKHSKGTNDVLKAGFKTFLRYGLGIRSVYFLFRRLRKALTEGIENLAQYSGAFNTSMSAMKSSLTRLKNSFATAFAPIIEQVAPILVYAANLISEVVTRIGMLIATLTGKNSFTRAKAVTEDYAKSLKNASSATDKNKESTDKLTDSWEEYKKTLAGFDDVEILKDMNKDDNDGNEPGAGSGNNNNNNGGYTGPTPEEMFEEVPIAEGLKDLAERIKEAWRTADFTELGTMVGEKIRDALENIPWDIIKATLNKIAKSIATFLNGFLETPGLFTVIGETIAEALNTAFGAVNTFATNFHWDSLGTAIADGINGFFSKFNFKLAAETVSNIALGLLSTFIAAVEKVEWQTVGEKVGEFLKNVKWIEILKKVGEAAGAVVGAVAGFVAGLFKGVPEAVAKWWEEHTLENQGKTVFECFLSGMLSVVKNIFNWIDANLFTPFVKGFMKAFGIETDSSEEMDQYGKAIIEGLLTGILTAIKGITNWIEDNIFKPFIDGFRLAFGIGSPSKVMADEGPNIIEGLKKGLEDNIDKLFEWFKKLPARIIEKIGDIVLTVTAKIGEVINDIKSKILDFKANITDKVNSIKDKILDFKANVTDKINSIKDKILDFKANVTDKVNNIKVKVLDFIGNIKDKKDSIKDKLLNFTANLKQKKDSIKEKILSGFTSKITKRDDSLNKNEKVLGGFTSKVTNLIDAIAKKAKLIKGVKAKVEYLEAKRGIKVKGGTVTKAMGGVFANGSWRSLPQFAMGGIIKNGIQRFASGGLPGYGSLFVAGEKGPEIVGNINGRTEILNKSQLASAIYSAVLRGMNTAVNSFGTFISAKLAESTNANLAAIQAGVLAIQNIADQNLIPAITSGRVIPYSMLANTEKQTTALEEIRELLKNNQNSLTYNELYSIIEDVVRKYMNIQFYIGDEQVARHANAGNAKIERRLNPVVR